MRGRTWLIVGGITVLSLAAVPLFSAPLTTSSGIGIPAGPASNLGGNVIKSVRGGLVHTVDLLCSTAPCEVAIFDDSVYPTSKLAVWESRISSLGSNSHYEFPVPLQTANGIVVDVGGGGKAYLTYE